MMRFELPLLALWAGLALVLSALTTRVVDWFVMTDELLYERLAISVAQLGSPLPHLHGEVIPNLNQLYPLLLAPVFRHGLVPDALHDAHALNAWVMSSACIPAFLLARRVTGRRLVAYAIALLTVCLPWIVLSSFLLTEVAGYPAFLWAVLAIQLATAAPSRRNDALALLGIGLAIFARTQFEVLLAVVPVAFFAHELGAAHGRIRDAARQTVRRHPVLAVAYAVLIVAAVLLATLGRISHVLGTYRGALEGQLLPDGIARSFVEHVATLALGLGILPFVVGLAWLLANVVRPPAKELHAFACVASVTILTLALEVTVFDLRFGAGSVRDRYLFYVAPLVLLGFFCALLDERWPRLVPARARGARRTRFRVRPAAGLRLPPRRLTGLGAERLAAREHAVAERRARPSRRRDDRADGALRPGLDPRCRASRLPLPSACSRWSSSRSRRATRSPSSSATTARRAGP